VRTYGQRAALVAALAAVLGVGCTGALNEEHQKRFDSEGVVRKGVDLLFRRTRVGDGTQTRWEEADASIIVTHQSVVIHSGDRFLLEITPRSTGQYRVSRERDRIAIQAGRGQSRVSWSFRPPEDADGWTEDVRAVIRAASAKSTRWGRVPDDADDEDDEAPSP
jgi:hypothetical protein